MSRDQRITASLNAGEAHLAVLDSLEHFVRDHPFASGFTSEHVRSLAGCARNCRVGTGEYLWRQGEQADVFYLIRSGEVALEISVPHQGPLRIETIGTGEVLGWSWLVPPYRWHFDARAISPVLALGLDGECLRQKCDRDPVLGYQVLKRFAPVIAQRLQATRLRVLDLYSTAKP